MIWAGISIVIILMSPALGLLWWQTVKMVSHSKEIQKQRQEELSYAYATISTAPLPSVAPPRLAPAEVDLRYDSDVIKARLIAGVNKEWRESLKKRQSEGKQG